MPSASTAEVPSGGRLLLVDDDENVLRSLKRVLRQGHWNIETATTGALGLEVLRRFSPEVVISDFRMPGMNGIEFLSRVKDESPKAQRMMLTGQADQQAIEEAINRSEVFRFLSKPWNDQELYVAVQSAFEQRAVSAENERLHALTQQQNAELRQFNAELEQRVILRTHQLMLAKREWETTFDTLDYPLAVVNQLDFSVTRANQAYAKAAGKPVKDIGAHPRCHQFLFDRDMPCHSCPLTGPGGLEQQSAEIKDGDKVYRLNVFPMDDGSSAVCSYRDVTEEQVLTRRMVESEKMVAVGNLAGGVAHEINNPLGGILAFSQLMKRDAGRSPEDLEALGLIEDSALRCKKIVDSLLKVSRRSSLDDRKVFNLAQCIDETVVLFRAQLKQHPDVTLALGLDSEPAEVFGDSGQLGQVALNLLQNGLYALGGKRGALTVKTGQLGDRCYFRVTDPGSGIKPEHLARIFEPHFTTKPPGEGTGLGLAIAYRIVKDHGGDFEVQSEVGEGSAFTVWFPKRPRSLA